MTNSNIYITIKDWIALVNKHNIPVEVIMEIGSMNGADANELACEYKPRQVFIIEAHPEFAKEIAVNYPYFYVCDKVAGNFNGTATFNSVKQGSANMGMSSMLQREDLYPSWDVEYDPVQIDAMRMDTFCDTMNLKSIDLLKIDVEGNSYEVLEGFGDMLWFVKCIHVECEHVPVWKGQKLYADVEKLLIGKGFIPVSMRIGFPQSDSVWVKKEFYNAKWFDV